MIIMGYLIYSIIYEHFAVLEQKGDDTQNRRIETKLIEKITSPMSRNNKTTHNKFGENKYHSR
jgi:hypothetical protein